MKQAFTLIELLIVVAIIAVLAAIAVPNFLEAQVRAKVSRVKTDMRSLATAIESYAASETRPPLGYWSWRSMVGWIDGSQTDDKVQPLNRLTTPIAYIGKLPKDVFSDKSGVVSYDSSAGQLTLFSLTATTNYWYETSSPVGSSSLQWWNGTSWVTNLADNRNRGSLFDMNLKGIKWVLDSPGPSLKRMDYGWMLWDDKNSVVYPYTFEMPYDPTNGTRSIGQIMRTNGGIVTTPDWYAGTQWCGKPENLSGWK